jgi:hypothetical protein
MSDDRRSKNIGLLIGAGVAFVGAKLWNNPGTLTRIVEGLALYGRFADPEAFAEMIADKVRRAEESGGPFSGLAYLYSLDLTPEERVCIYRKLYPPQEGAPARSGSFEWSHPARRYPNPTGRRGGRPSSATQLRPAQLRPAQPAPVQICAAPVSSKKKRAGRTLSPLAVRVCELVGSSPEITYTELLDKTFIVSYPKNPERTKRRMAEHGKALRDVLRYHYAEKLPVGKRGK